MHQISVYLFSVKQLACCICYIVCRCWLCSYVMYWKGGYQDKDKAISATTTKLKGIALTNCTHLNITIHGGVDGNRIWDVADYVMPPQVNVVL